MISGAMPRLVPLTLSCLALAALALAGCGEAAPSDAVTFDGAPELSVAGVQGHFVVGVRSSPSPPRRGTDAFQLRVTDVRTSAPVDGLTLTVTPFMPAMGHGTSVAPEVTAEGGGVYVARGVNLFMPGRWELRVALHGAVDDAIAPAWDIP